MDRFTALTQIAPQTVFIELINFETWEVPNFLCSSIIIIRLGDFHPALWLVGSKLVVAQCHWLYPEYAACINPISKSSLSRVKMI